ncbi:MAG: nuclear transport factor 2 family protein [Oscillospiraceae bacterium]|nr:nuclear transport factor 2 family protein [Oscillospiraceae bacterium]
MDDRKLLTECYNTMYQGMVQKNKALLDRVLDDSFALLHMTGMCQSKRQYIEAIINGALNYYSAQTDDIDIAISDDTARLVGQSRVTAAVFGGGKHAWQLQLAIDAVKRDGQWYFTGAKASTY